MTEGLLGFPARRLHATRRAGHSKYDHWPTPNLHSEAAAHRWHRPPGFSRSAGGSGSNGPATV